MWQGLAAWWAGLVREVMLGRRVERGLERLTSASTWGLRRKKEGRKVREVVGLAILVDKHESGGHLWF
jgi:hypothetical protein